MDMSMGVFRYGSVSHGAIRLESLEGFDDMEALHLAAYYTGTASLSD
jgi:hypothetical protein